MLIFVSCESQSLISDKLLNLQKLETRRLKQDLIWCCNVLFVMSVSTMINFFNCILLPPGITHINCTSIILRLVSDPVLC